MAELTATKIKVNRAALIKQLKEVLAKDQSGHARKLKAHERARDRATADIEAQAHRLQIDPKQININYGGEATFTIHSKVKVPSKPRDIACDLRNTIAVLELSNEPTIPLTANQYQRYFPCKVEDDDE